MTGRYVSRVDGLWPPASGVEVTVSTSGRMVTLRSFTAEPVVVLGIEHENYLRVTPDGAEENVLSLTSLVDAGADPAALRRYGMPVQELWRPVGQDPVVCWRDLRVGWESTAPALAGTRALRRLDWTVPLRVGPRDVAVRGRVEWLAGLAG